MTSFYHLHTHSVYSLLDGSLRFDPLAERLHALGQPGMALTDHGTMSGVYQFQQKFIDAGLKPLIGCELYVTEKMDIKNKERKNYHLTVLAQNQVGYKNLCCLSSFAYRDGFYRKPCVDLALLVKYNEGLIVLSGCLGSEVAKLYFQSPESAENLLRTYNATFRDRYYLELQTNGLPEQLEFNDWLIKMHKVHNIPVVVTSDTHYLNASDSVRHKISYCVRSGQTVHNCKWQSIPLHLLSIQEVSDAVPYADRYGAIENTKRIAESIHSIDMRLGSFSPKLPLTLDRRGKRIDYELSIINKMGVGWYIRMVADLVRFCKDNDIFVGPGRGSAAGSLVCYYLGITDVDPIKHGLFFERFLNPDRVSLPDIDLDVAPDGRDRVMAYLHETYGKNNVAQITTFNNLKAKSSIRDAGRALGVPLDRVDALAKTVPEQHQGFTPNLADIDFPSIDPTDLAVIDAAKFIEGIPRHSGTHAAAVVISDQSLLGSVPLSISKSGSWQTQWQMSDVEGSGLVKFDLLGLNTLSILKKCKETTGQWPSYGADEAKIYQMLSDGRTSGVFQVESQGLTTLLRRLKPDCFSDIVAAVALFRPGPLAFIDDFIARKRETRKIQYWHPLLEPVLKETYGLPLYQEQVMAISRVLAGYSGAEADNLRRIIGKKKIEQIESEGRKFVAGCVENGVNSATASQIWSKLEDFGAYSFCKSHAVAYSKLTYQTAWFRCYFPAHFFAALLSCVKDQNDVVRYIASAKSEGIRVVPPHLNKSGTDFTAGLLDGVPVIYYNLNGIRNIGKVAQDILQEREINGDFRSFHDFLARLNINSRACQYLLMSGAFDQIV